MTQKTHLLKTERQKKRKHAQNKTAFKMFFFFNFNMTLLKTEE